MAADNYVPLRVHTEYSLVDGVIRIKPLAESCKKMGIPAVAVTDKDNIFAAFKHSSACHAQGVQAIVGADLSISDDSFGSGVLPVLARSRQGYLSLSSIMSASQMRREDGVPYVRIEDFNGADDGLIALSGGFDGVIGKLISSGRDIEAEQAALTLSNTFPGRFYLEVSRVGREGEDAVNHRTVEIAEKLDLPIVATHPSMFLSQDDFVAHATRVAIARGEVLDDPDKMGYTAEQYLLSPNEMREKFADMPGAIENSSEIARRCAFALEYRDPCLPDFPESKKAGVTEDELLAKHSNEGLNEIIKGLLRENPKNGEQDYRDRLKTELDVIQNMGFPGYFLIVADFIRWAKENEIPVGPGRGSGAGSLVAFALGITDLDPLRYDLLFERFLNPDRVSMPDFDIDFCMDNRDRVIDYVSDKYGAGRVSRIITYGRMAARGVIRDVGRVMGFGYGFVDALAKTIPFQPDMTLERALEESDSLREALDNDPDTKVLFNRALELEGLARNAGKHAGGIIIAPSDIADFTPAYFDSNSGQVTTQFDMKDVESIGLVKFDFLGLRTLTIIDQAVRSVRSGQDAGFDIRQVPLDDKKTFDLLKNCETTAVFQLESPGMKKLISRLQPDSFEEIVALVALFRPGPLQSGMVDDFVDRKHGTKTVEYPHPDLEEILKPTYGVILYQEQVMQISQKLAGYTLGGADLLRRAMGKKKPEEMAKQRSIFTEGATARGVDPEIATYIFDLMEKFAGYGFNKSHSAAYALVAYQTAYLKAHYPAEFMAATLSSDMDKTDKVAIFMRESKRMGIEVAPPNVNMGKKQFLPNIGQGAPRITYGLSAIKGLGSGLVQSIVAERSANGPFQSVADVGSRLTGKMNSRTLEKIIAAGACDSFPGNRAQATMMVSDAIKGGRQEQQSKDAGQGDMFGSSDSPQSIKQSLPDAEDWSDLERLAREHKALGLYLSGHPASVHWPTMQAVASGTLGDVIADMDRRPISKDSKTPRIIGGLVVGRRDVKGNIFLSLEDETGAINVAIFSDLRASVSEKVNENQVVLVMGAVSIDDFSGGYRIAAERVLTMDEIKDIQPEDIHEYAMAGRSMRKNLGKENRQKDDSQSRQGRAPKSPEPAASTLGII